MKHGLQKSSLITVHGDQQQGVARGCLDLGRKEKECGVEGVP